MTFAFTKYLNLQAYLVLLYFDLLHFIDIAGLFVCFFQLEGVAHHQQKDRNSLYCDPHSTAAVWHRTLNISKVHLYTVPFYPGNSLAGQVLLPF